MEKENRKSRENARREYNDTVRSLVKFVRKRDPRYKLYLQSQSQINTPPIPSTAVKPQQELPEIYIKQAWQRVDAKDLHDDLDWATAEGGDLEEWECVACRKIFRSEAAWDSHERSKKHMKEVERLKKEMQSDDQDLDLNAENEDEAIYINDPLLVGLSSSINLVPEAPSSAALLLPQPVNDSNNSVEVPDTGEEDSLKLAEISGKRLRAKTGTQPSDILVSTSETELTEASNVDDIHSVCSPESPVSQGMSKRDKRRARQAKKVELEANNNSLSQRCNFCAQGFASKTQLFSHISETGHALSLNQEQRQHKGKKKRR
jgi:DnaJ family protein A protein 5